MSASASTSTYEPSTSTPPTSVGVSNGDSEDVKVVEAHHAVNLTNYIFNVGYMGQQWADVQLTFFETALKLHRIILSRSPFLAQYLVNTAPGTTVHLKFRDDNVTSEAVFTCIHHLYNPAFHLVNSSNSRSVLVTALIFDGISELAQHAFNIARESIGADTVLDWVTWLGQVESGYIGQKTPASEEWDDSEGRYGSWTAQLKQEVFNFITRTPPSELSHLYTHLPFSLLKKTLESPLIPFPTMQARFSFAKQTLAARKKAVAATGQEENAVLAVGASGMEVQVTRRARKTRQLWKVEG